MDLGIVSIPNDISAGLGKFLFARLWEDRLFYLERKVLDVATSIVEPGDLILDRFPFGKVFRGPVMQENGRSEREGVHDAQSGSGRNDAKITRSEDQPQKMIVVTFSQKMHAIFHVQAVTELL